MNALIEFLILAGGSFFTFMFLSYRDAIRKKQASGPLASLLNNFKGWQYEDKKGPRGIIFRQPIWIKALLALFLSLLVRAGYDLFFDFFAASGKLSMFTGYTGWLLLAAVIFIAMILSNLWPNVKNKIVDIKDDTLKKGNEVIDSGKASLEKAKEEVLETKDAVVEEIKEVKEEVVKPKEAPQPKKKDDPDDIINEYLG